MPSKRPNEDWQTLDGQNVHPVQPGNMRDCREFLKDYENVGGTTVYGFDRFIYQFISEEYSGEINYDIDKIKLWSLDIETSSENGFPKPEEAIEEGPADHPEELQDQETHHLRIPSLHPHKGWCGIHLLRERKDPVEDLPGVVAGRWTRGGDRLERGTVRHPVPL